jgi:hypothetical protein
LFSTHRQSFMVRSVVTFFMKGRQDQRNCSEAGLLKQTLLQTPGEQQTGLNFEQSSLREIALHTVPGTYRVGYHTVQVRITLLPPIFRIHQIHNKQASLDKDPYYVVFKRQEGISDKCPLLILKCKNKVDDLIPYRTVQLIFFNGH